MIQKKPLLYRTLYANSVYLDFDAFYVFSITVCHFGFQ